MARTKKPKTEKDAGSTEPVVDDAADENLDTAKLSEEAEPAKEEAEKPDLPDDLQATEFQETVTDVEEIAEISEPAPVAPARKGGFTPALIGGVLAAGLGFFAARTEVLDSFLPGGSNKTETANTLAGLQDSSAKQADAVSALRARFDALKQTDLAPINTQLAALQADGARLSANIDAQKTAADDFGTQFVALTGRVDTLERQPMTDGASDAAIAAYDRELASLQEAVAAQRADVETMIANARATEAAAQTLENNAANAARNARNQATYARLQSALDSGDTYAPILSELVAAGVTIPPELNVSANDGVVTLATLNDAFPSAARDALSAARAESGGSGGLGGFLQRHLGARSVQPKQGDDPDAILSRAEAAATSGDLSQALKEITALPDAARAHMQGWADSAATRLTTLQAAQDLAKSLNTN